MIALPDTDTNIVRQNHKKCSQNRHTHYGLRKEITEKKCIMIDTVVVQNFKPGDNVLLWVPKFLRNNHAKFTKKIYRGPIVQ